MSSNTPKKDKNATIPLDDEGNPIIGRAISRMNLPPKEPDPNEGVPRDVSSILAKANPPKKQEPAPKQKPISVLDTLSRGSGSKKRSREVIEPEEEESQDSPKSSRIKQSPFGPGPPMPTQPPTSKEFTKGAQMESERRRDAEEEEAEKKRNKERSERANKVMSKYMEGSAKKEGEGE